MLNKIKKIILVMSFITYIILFILNIINIGYLYVLPLVFEIFIIILCGYKYVKNDDLDFEKIAIIKNIFLFITLILGLISNNINVNQIILKIALTLTIVLEVLTFLKINGAKLFVMKKKKRA